VGGGDVKIFLLKPDPEITQPAQSFTMGLTTETVLTPPIFIRLPGYENGGMIYYCCNDPIDHLTSELLMAVSFEPARFIFPDHVIWKLRNISPPLGTAKRSGD